MKHQIQLYNESDYEDRQVVAEREGQISEAELNAWYTGESAKVEVPEGKKLSLVQDNHPWFKFENPETVTQTPPTTTAPSVDVNPMEGKPLEFADLAMQVLEQNKKERTARHETEVKVKQALAGLNIS